MNPNNINYQSFLDFLTLPPVVKMVILTVVWFLAGCKDKTTLHRPDLPAKYSISIGIFPAEQSPNEQQVEAVFQLLTEQAENCGIVYQLIERSVDNQRITFKIIGLLTDKGITDPGLDFYSAALGRKPALEFWDTYRNTDAEVQAFFMERYQQYELFGHLSLTFSMVAMETTYPYVVIAAVRPENVSFVDSLFSLPEMANSLPPEMVWAWSFYPTANPEWPESFELYALKRGSTSGPFLTGKNVAIINSSKDETSKAFKINLEFTPEAALVWAKKTREAAADSNRAIAILIDGRVLIAPQVMSEIRAGVAPIHSIYDPAEFSKLITKLKLGILPFDLKIVQAKKL